METVKPIETVYKGFRFRSRLEARWAVLFDAMGIKYLYEPEGYRLSDGTCYLPDFFLPDMDQFFEVKGVLKLTDERKIKRFIRESNGSVTIGYDDFTFTTCSRYEPGNPPAMENKSNSVLMKCNKCGKYYFSGITGSWGCTNCGYYDGDDTSQWVSSGDLDTDLILCWKFEKTKFRKAVEKAKQARFEHGESGS